MSPNYYPGTDTPRGSIRHLDLYCQALDFSGLQFGRCSPTDVDFFIELGGKEVILGEFKRANTSVSYGQRRALTTLAMLAHQKGVEVLAFIARHNSPSKKSIDAASCLVTEILCPRQRCGWHSPGSDRHVRELIDSWRAWHRTQSSQN